MTEPNKQAARTPARGPRSAKAEAGPPRQRRQPKTPRDPEVDSANADTSTQAQAAAPRPPSKLDGVITLLRQPAGVTLDEIVAATGWQRHSARGALAGAVKKKLGAGVVSERVDGVLRYRAPEAS